MSATNPTTPSALPSAMRVRLEAMNASAAAPAPGEAPPAPAPGEAPPAPAPGEAPPAPAGERVTLTRAEYNELQANADRVQAMTGREEMTRLRLEEAQQRLTELEKSNKSVPNAPTASAPASAPAVDVSGITFTEKETEDYGESREFVAKVAKVEAAAIVSAHMAALEARIAAVEATAGAAVGAVNTNNARTFNQQVVAKVPNLPSIVKHQHWEAFIDGTEPLSGATYGQLIGHHVERQNVDALVNIYNAFETKYVKPAASAAGFTGASPSSGAGELPADPAARTKLKFSDRTKASEDYRKGRITFEQLEVVNKTFDAADKQGNIDFSA